MKLNKALIGFKVKKLILSLLLVFLSIFLNGAEFLIIDKVISWNTDARGAFYMFWPDSTMPADWSYPDDYYNGMIYTRYEIQSVATNIPFGMQFNIFQWKNPEHTIEGELCEPISWIENGAGSIVAKGSSPATWWQASGGVDFSKVNDFQSLCPTIWCKDPVSPIGKPGEGGDEQGIAWSKRFNWFPVTLRVTVVAVSAGSVFSGWENYFPTGTGIKDIQEPHISIRKSNEDPSIYYITSDSMESFDAELITSEGKVISQVCKSGPGEITLNLETYPPGIYFVRTGSTNKMKVFKIMLH